MPDMFDDSKGLRRQFVPNEGGEKGANGKTGAWKAREDAPPPFELSQLRCSSKDAKQGS